MEGIKVEFEYSNFDTNCITLFYDVHMNYFIDEDGEVVYSIYEHVTPDALYLFYLNQHDMYFPHNTIAGMGVELVYPTDCYACVNFDCSENPYYEGEEEAIKCQ